MKVRTSVLIESEILEKAKELGLNLSQCFENCLKILIASMENTYNQIIRNQIATKEKEGFRSVFSEKDWWTGRDLNPRPPDCKSGVHSRLNYRPFIIDG